MSLHSTRENRYFGASFTSVGDVEVEILLPPKWTFSELFCGSGAQYLDLYTPYGHETYTKCLLSRVLCNDIEFYLRGVHKNPILPPRFEKVFFRKISLRGLQLYIFSLVYHLWCWRINARKFSDWDTTLK